MAGTRLSATGRSIPAWAGETQTSTYHRFQRAVYPRVGGGNLFNEILKTITEGLSPRGRGKPEPLAACSAKPRSIPAWAGETREIP